jgi:yecA family protein
MGVGASPEERRSQRGMTSTSSAFTYDELDAILRGPGGHDGPIGISAIDGLIAALVAAPTFVHPDEWVPLIFGGHKPRIDAGSAEERAVRTIFNRYNEVSTTLSERPHTYQPIFMIDRDGSVVARDWAVGFTLGIGLRPQAWGDSILLTEHRRLLTPILVYHDPRDGLLPDMSRAEKLRRRAAAYLEIPQAVAAIRAICNPYRAAEACAEPKARRSSRRTRR